MTGIPWQDLAAIEEESSLRLAQRRIAVRMRTVSRFVALPAFAAMLGGLFLFWADSRPLPIGKGATAYVIASVEVVKIADLANNQQVFAPQWWLSVGVLALIALPAVSVGLVLSENVRLRRWGDALAAVGVLSILALGVLIGHR